MEDDDYEELDEMMYEDFKKEYGMSETEMKLRGILDKIVQNYYFDSGFRNCTSCYVYRWWYCSCCWYYFNVGRNFKRLCVL